MFSLFTLVSFAQTADDSSWTFSFSETSFTSSAKTKTLNNVEWTLTCSASTIQTTNSALYLGSASKGTTAATLATSGFSDKTITKVVVNCMQNKEETFSVSVKIGGADFGTSQTLGTAYADKEFTGNASGNLEIDFASSTAHRIQIKSISIWYDGTTAQKQPSNVSFGTTKAFTITSGEEFTAPTATAATGYDGTITYAISPTGGIATIDASTGALTLTGATGTATVTATAAATNNFAQSTDSYTLTVNPKPAATLGAYTLVTDATTLTAGSEIVFAYCAANATEGVVMGEENTTSQGAHNNRLAVASTFSADHSSVTPGEGAHSFVLEACDATHWYVKSLTDGNYLSCNSNASSNVLGYSTTADEKCQALITIADGVTTVKFDGVTNGTTRNYLRHNSTAGSLLFSCYAQTSQDPVSIYIKRPIDFTMDEEQDNSTAISQNTGTKSVQLKRTLQANVWNTFCVPFNLTKAQLGDEAADILAFTSVEGNTLHFTAQQSITAGTPCLVRPTKEIADPVFYDVEITAAAAGSVTFGGYSFSGTYSPRTMSSNDDEAFLKTDGTICKPTAGGDHSMQMKGLRCYFVLPSMVSQAKAVFDTETTGIGSVFAGGNAGKAASNDTSSVYTLSGQRISLNGTKTLKRGVYVSKGRKFVVK